MAFNSLAIQDLTYTQTGYSLVPLKVTYVSGSALTVDSYAPATGLLTITIIHGVSTATAIAAAVNAATLVNQYVAVTVTGTGATVQKTCVSAALSGGVATAKASLTLNGTFRITAKSAGTAGNSTTFKFTSGATAGSEIVSVSTAAITVQIADGVSTYQQVLDAVEADGSADALVDLDSAGPTLEGVAKVNHAATFLSLTGGLAAAAASVVVQDLTYAADATGTALNGKTVTYTTGATAGSEVVTVASGNISVQIENGVSTATQIATALNAAAPFTTPYNVTVSGTGSTAQKTVNALATTGATPVRRGWYQDGTSVALTSSYVAVVLGQVGQLDLVNDETSGVKGVNYSWDGTNTAGTLLFGQNITIWPSVNGSAPSVVYLKYISSAPAYRLMVTPL